MKKLFLTIACAVCALAVSAQRASSSSSSFFSTEKADQPITICVRAGMNFSNFTGDIDDLDSRIGFNAGVVVDFPLMQSLYLQSGLFVTQKGAKYEEDGDEMKFNPLYIQIPVLASYRYNFSDATQLQVNFGPYLAYGISGKYKVEVEDMGKGEIDFFGDDDDQFGGKRFEVGLQVGAGVTINKFYIGCAYEFGLTNAFDNKWDTDEDDDPISIKGKNSNFMINVGYNF